MATPRVVGSAVSGTIQSSATLTLSDVTIPAGSNRALIVGLAYESASATATLTYGGQALTRLADEHLNTSSSDRIQLWYLLAPPVGTADLVLTLSTSVGYIGMWAQPLDTVAQTGTFGTVATQRNGSNAPWTVNVTAAVGDLVIDATGAYRGSDFVMTPGAAQTLIADINNLPSNDLHTAGSYQTATDTTVPVLWTFSPGASPYTVAVAIKGAEGGGEALTLDAEGGTVAIAGGGASLRVSRRLSAVGGTVTVTGGAATLARGRTLSAAGGTVALAGGDATLALGRRLIASGGTVTLTGGAATLRKTYRLAAQGGTVAIRGGDATFSVGGDKTLSAEGGTVAIAGGPATLRVSRRLFAGPGTLTVSAGPATLRLSRHLPADGGTLALLGGAAALTVHRRLSATGGTFTVSGGDATLAIARRLVALGGAVAVTGGEARFTYSGAVVPDSPPAHTWTARARRTTATARRRATTWRM